MTVLAVVVFLLLGERAWHGYVERRDLREREQSWAAERQSLLNRIEARTPLEFVAMETAPRPKPVREPSENAMRPGEHLVGA